MISADQLSIVKVKDSDLEQLQQIAKYTFVQTYGGDNTNDDMSYYLAANFNTKQLESEFYDSDCIFYFAIKEDNIIGYIKLNKGAAQTQQRLDNSVELERIYVLSSHQGNHVGQALCDKAIEIGKEHHFDWIWLGVWEKNPRAIRFYERNGFKKFDNYIFKLGLDDQTDYMMRLKL